MTRGPKVVGEASKDAMRKILKDIQSGEFAEEFLKDINGDRKVFNKLREENKNLLIEKIGNEIRSSFKWNNDKRIIDRNKN